MKNFSELIEKFNGLDVKIRYSVFIGAVLLFCALDYFLIIRWQLGVINKIKEERVTLSQNIGNVQRDKQRIEQIKKGLEDTRLQLAAMNKKVRLATEVPLVLQEISRTASESGVVINQLTPQKQALEVLIKSPEGNYCALPIVIQGHSGYHKFGRFLNKLENGNLYFTVREFRIDSNEKENANLNISVVLKVLLLDKNPPPEEKKKK